MKLGLFALFACTLTLSTGCGASYAASGGSRFELDQGKAIDDEDIRKAFEAAPQLSETSRVAYYAFDDRKAGDIDRMLSGIPRVKSTYHIPPLLVSGTRRYHEGPSSGDVSVKKMRLLAARAGADVLVIFDHGYRGGNANPLAALNLLIVPALFVPFLDNETESYAQAWVVDVRNGYFYGDASAEAKGGSSYVTIYAARPEAIFDQQWPTLLSTMKTKLEARLTPSGAKKPPNVAVPAPGPPESATKLATPQTTPQAPPGGP